jgi:hypothetical protein
MVIGVLTFMSGGCIACSSEESASNPARPQNGGEILKSSPPETVRGERPLITALELPLGSRTTISALTGTIHVTRKGKDVKGLEVGSEIQPGDLLQVTANSSVLLKDDAGHETTLTDRTGEWYKFVDGSP